MRRNFLILGTLIALNSSCQNEDNYQIHAFEDIEKFEFNNGTFDVTCKDGRKETGVINLAQACPELPPNPLADIYGFDGVFCASYQSGDFDCWSFDEISSPGRLDIPSYTSYISNVDIGFMAACGIDEISGLRCWGDNARGHLNIPLKYSGAGKVKSVTVGEDFVCAVTSEEGDFDCWGGQEQSELHRFLPEVRTDAKEIISVSSSVCVAYQDDSLACFGPDFDNIDPKRKTGVKALYSNKITGCAVYNDETVDCFSSFDMENPIVKNAPPSAIKQIDNILINSQSACAFRSGDLQKICWGDLNNNEAIFPDEVSDAKKIVVGNDRFCAMQKEGSLLCWKSGNIPAEPFPSHKAKFITAGESSVCSITEDGVPTCWGKNSFIKIDSYYSDMFSIDSFIDSNDPFAVSQQTISLGRDHSCFLQQGYLQCRGNNFAGQGSLYGPADEMINLSIVSGLHHNCVIREDNTAVCWGDNTQGQTRVPSSLDGKVKAIDAGANHTCAVTTDNQAVCWGTNTHGQSKAPENLGPVKSVKAGRLHSCALENSGKLSCWGDNRHGQLNVPSFESAVKDFELGFDHTCAILSDDSVKCWGKNDNRENHVPSDLGAVSQIALGDSFSCAIRAKDSTVRCWGKGAEGQIAVPSKIGLDTDLNPGYAPRARAIYNRDLILKKKYSDHTQARNYAGPFFEFEGLRNSKNTLLSYDLVVNYSSNCNLFNQPFNSTKFGIQVRNPNSGLYLTKEVPFSGVASVKFENLAGLSELSFSIGFDFLDQDRASVMEFTANSHCSFTVTSVNVIPTSDSIISMKVEADFLKGELSDHYQRWLIELTDGGIESDQIQSLIQELDVSREDIVRSAADFIEQADLNPVDYDLSSFNISVIEAGLFSPEEEAVLIDEKFGEIKRKIRRPLSPNRRPYWFDDLADLFIPQINLDASQYLEKELLQYSKDLALLETGLRPSGFLQDAEEKLRSSLNKVEDFLSQSQFLKDNIKDELDGTIASLLNIAIDYKSQFCEQRYSEGTVINGVCQ